MVLGLETRVRVRACTCAGVYARSCALVCVCVCVCVRAGVRVRDDRPAPRAERAKIVPKKVKGKSVTCVVRILRSLVVFLSRFVPRCPDLSAGTAVAVLKNRNAKRPDPTPKPKPELRRSQQPHMGQKEIP